MKGNTLVMALLSPEEQRRLRDLDRKHAEQDRRQREAEAELAALEMHLRRLRDILNAEEGRDAPHS